MDYSCEGGIENPSLGITVCIHAASLVITNGDPRDGFFYPTLTLMIDSYIITLFSRTRCKNIDNKNVLFSVIHNEHVRNKTINLTLVHTCSYASD